MGRINNSVDEWSTWLEQFQNQPAYRKPLAFGIGIATVSRSGNLLDTFFPLPNYQTNYGAAAVMADVVGHLSGTASYQIQVGQLADMLDYLRPFEGDGKKHDNIDAIKAVLNTVQGCMEKHGAIRVPVVSFIAEPNDDLGPQGVPDAYLRLHLLSHRMVKPNEIKLDGIFAKLPNVVFTNEGPVAQEDLPNRRLDALMRRHPLHVTGVDKFPRMVDYVVPSGVRIADASRVRLGAYLGEGTTVMHEGFCNFNAGTLTGTPSEGYNPRTMVEGRISAGVVVGDQSDIGGGASIMGTLSGGGKEVITIGRGCLIGANAGTGISLGDLCVIEAGLYVTAGMPVVYLTEKDGKKQSIAMKAYELSGKNGLTFRRNGVNGRVEVLDKPNGVVLNEALHKN